MEKNTVPLPNDLLILILLRLPVKSLLRFRCVSKSWLSLISDPHFARSHCELASASARTTHRIMILKSSSPQTRSIDLDASLHDDSATCTDTNLSFQLPTPNFIVQTMPSCRRFLLLWDHHSHIHLWNPSTGAHKKLPLSPIVSNVNPYSFTFLYGFGYDPSKDDYLVVLASYNSFARDWKTEFEFFSLRTNSWGRIEGNLLHYMDDCDESRAGTLLNGAIHWLAFHWRGSGNVIVAFDLVERSLSEIPLPNDIECDDFSRCDLWVHGGLLSLCVQGIDDPVAEIWVMKEYKVQSSWTKCIVVPYDDISNWHFLPICSTKSGDVFGIDGIAGLVKCNPRGEVLERCLYEHEGEEEAAANVHHIRMRAAMYTESLLSLPSDDNNGGQAKDE